MGDEKTLGEEVRTLPVPLTRDELLEAGSQLAQLEQQLEEQESVAAAARAAHKARMEELGAERARLAGIIRTRQEMRPVSVDVVAHYRVNLARYTRRDTGEVLGERPLTAEERQGVIEFPDGAAGACAEQRKVTVRRGRGQSAAAHSAPLDE